MVAIVSLARRIVGRLRREAESVAPELTQRLRYESFRRAALHRRVKIDDLAADRRPLVVFFAPEAGIIAHHMAHCLIARTLQERGHRVLIVGCSGAFPRCVVMDGYGLPQDATGGAKQKVCVSCGQASMDMT